MPDFYWAHDDYRPTTVWKCPECDHEEKGFPEFPLAEAQCAEHPTHRLIRVKE